MEESEEDLWSTMGEEMIDRTRGVKVELLQEYVLLRAVRTTREWLQIP
jgi:hypothetical protein